MDCRGFYCEERDGNVYTIDFELFSDAEVLEYVA